MSFIENPIPIRLKTARKKVGISQKELGLRSGFKDSSASGKINHYEKGRHSPSVETLSTFAKVLNIPMSYFLCESELDAELCLLMTTFSHDDKQRVVDIVRCLSDIKASKEHRAFQK